MIAFKVSIKDGIKARLKKMLPELDKCVKEFLKEAQQEFTLDLMQRIDLDDHTLQDLADMGHPYAKRNFGLIPHDPWDIHTQSGYMVDSWDMSKGFEAPPNLDSFTYVGHATYALMMGFSSDKQEEGYMHALYTIDASSNSKMYPRPIVSIVAEKTKPKLTKMFYAKIDKLKFWTRS